MDRQCIALQDNPLGIVPEQVLVLETVGRIETFINTVKHMDWNGWVSTGLKRLNLHYGFEDETRPNKVLKAQFCHFSDGGAPSPS